MASIQRSKDRKGKYRYRIQFYDLEGSRHSIGLGRVSNQAATEAAGHVDGLLDAAKYRTSIPAKTIAWLEQDAPEKIVEKLASVGLCQDRARSVLAVFVDEYIASREDAAANTIRNFNNSRMKLVDFFGGEKLLHEILEGDADDWRQWLVNQNYSDSTISKAVKHAKQFLLMAERKGLVRSNPFHHLRAGGEQNDSRKAFVDRKTIERVIEYAPDTQWKLIIALARYGGLRCPSEILELTWADIDWDAGTIRVSSPKTKRLGKSHRVIPMFPELKPLLEQAFSEAEERSLYVITKFRNATANLRTPFLRILNKAGVEPWERLFQNLRASRETELAAGHPIHVVTAWMGNSELVASRHYLQVREEDFEAARGAKSGAIGAAAVLKAAPYREVSSGKEQQEVQASSGVASQAAISPILSDYPIIPPRGVEPLSSD